MEDLALLAQQGDMLAYSQLFEDHEKMIYKFVRKYSLGLESYEDLYSLGLVFFCEAVKKYNPEKGKFTTVLGNELNFGFMNYKNRKQDSLISIPPTWAYDSLRLEVWVKEFTVKNGKYPTDEESMKFLGVDRQRYLDIRSVHKQSTTADLSELIYLRNDIDVERDITNKVYVKWLINKFLNDKEKTTIELIFFENKTNMEAAEALGISNTMVANHKSKALKKMKKGLVA